MDQETKEKKMGKSFSNINISSEILQAVESLGYKKLTDIQEKVGPVAMAGHNILGSSATGSGKTLAFLMPIMERTDWEESNAVALILAPSRELSLQIKKEYDTLGRYKKLSAVALFGKQPFKDQVSAMKNRHQAVCGTPGRVLDHIKRGTLDIESIRYLVIDEVDELLDRGFQDEVMQIVRSLRKVKQTMMFSATITESVKELAMNITKDFKIIEAETEGEEKLHIEEILYRIDARDKFNALISLIYGRKPKSMIIFVNTKDECDRIQNKLEQMSIESIKIHGGMMQDDRLKAMEKFKNKDVPYLVATDVAARGIDISDLDISLSYDFPVEKESFVHRAGRTGRNFKEGTAIYFVSEYDGRKVAEVEKYVGYSLNNMLNMDYEPFKTGKDEFLEFQKNLKKNKPVKKVIHKDITRLYINGGKNKKIRPLDIVGTLNSIEGIKTGDIGIIQVMDNGSYIDILNGKGDIAINGLSTKKIKGKVLRVEKARK